MSTIPSYNKTNSQLLSFSQTSTKVDNKSKTDQKFSNTRNLIGVSLIGVGIIAALSYTLNSETVDPDLDKNKFIDSISKKCTPLVNAKIISDELQYECFPLTFFSQNNNKPVENTDTEMSPLFEGIFDHYPVCFNDDPEHLNEEFQIIFEHYLGAIQYTQGIGEHGQRYIDTEWKNLQNFAKEHPEFNEKLPNKKHIAHDDGFAGGIHIALADLKRHNRI